MEGPSQNSARPWRWIPTLYFGEGVPYVVVMTLAVVMYKNLGISNTDIALYTSWLYLPWVIKPLWSPLVDLFRTKRLWIVGLQFVIGAAFAQRLWYVGTTGAFRDGDRSPTLASSWQGLALVVIDALTIAGLVIGLSGPVAPRDAAGPSRR